jgi:hypothetical protein
MKVIIAGSRHLTGQEAQDLVRNAISASGWASQITEIVHGGARGIDSAAHAVVEALWPVKVFPAQWQKHGPKAGPIRNGLMADYADALIAIPHKFMESRGTRDMIGQMRAKGKPVFVYGEAD